MKNERRSFVFLMVFACWISTLTDQRSMAADGVSAEQSEFFEAKIRPVFVKHCYKCHSEEAASKKGGLQLDLRDSLLKGGDSGPALVPGNAKDSLLMSALRHEEIQMPPKSKLPSSVIADFERWIQMGAPDPRSDKVVVVAKAKVPGADPEKGLKFWSFQKPVRHKLPAVVQKNWPKNEIDHFILASLESRKMPAADPADRRLLIRRAYMDLIGLPPEPDAVERFVADKSDAAFARVVDELLASPHYGERWGRYWLDLARYAEDQAHTHQARMYPRGYMYRDWVVRALNDDLPYDQFLRFQIAADQLKSPDLHNQRAAMGLFALGPVYYQDNGEKEKALADEWDDRVDTLMRGTQALTVACARCHDHKYDPISTADYYGLTGVFASSEYQELPSVPDKIVEARRDADKRVTDQQLAIDTFLAGLAPSVRPKLASQIPAYMQAAWKVMKTDQGGKRDKAKLDQIAKSEKLSPALLERWVAWMNEEPGSGKVGSDRPYLQSWRDFRKSATAQLKTDEGKARQAAEIGRIGQTIQSRVEILLSQRALLARQFGANYAFVSSSDRSRVEPGTIPLGNLFDDKKGVLLDTALASDPFKAAATKESLGVETVAQGWGGATQIAKGIRFNFSSLGSDSRQHGQITNDAWSSEGGIRTLGQAMGAGAGRTEQGIGMHANSLITFNLNEIRRAGLISPTEAMMFQVDRAGINDDSFGQGSSVHIAAILSKPHERNVAKGAILAGYVNGKLVKVDENDGVYHFEGKAPEPILANGKFATFQVPIPAEAQYLTIVATGAQISETENTINSDHAVLSNVRLVYKPTDRQLAEKAGSESAEGLSKADQERMSADAALLSEMLDEQGVLGLASSQIESLLEGASATSLAAMQRRLESLKSAASAITVTMAHTLVDGASRDLKIHIAGDPAKPGSVAVRSFPAVLTMGRKQAFTTHGGSGRLELAHAIASKENPLTARVIVNRIWAGHFGSGLVRTLNNFGQLGDRPSHPELLDNLAVELMESGWSIKGLHRRIMNSSTYQQSSTGAAGNQELDPENRLLWRMNRRRLEVEPWRDSVLAVSGRLNREVGGASSRLTDDHRRRTLYGFISRHQLSELLRLFDFPDPNITAGERAVTTVPLQQLFVLNSDFIVAQSKAFAQRLTAESGTDPDRVKRAFALLYGRHPSDSELQMALEFIAGSSSSGPGDSLTGLEQFCLAMLGTNEFAYVD